MHLYLYTLIFCCALVQIANADDLPKSFQGMQKPDRETALVDQPTTGSHSSLNGIEVAGSDSPARTQSERPDTIKVMSYNIHYGKGMDGKIDLPRIARVILEESPDLVGLQEIKDHAMAETLGHLTGMRFVFGPSLGKNDGYGDAILSKHPFDWVENYSIPSASSSRYQAMGVDVDLSEEYGKGIKVRLINTHFDWLRTIGSREARLAAVEVIEKGFFADPSIAAILTGDLNATPESDPLMRLAAKGWVIESLGNPLKTIPSKAPTRQIDYVLLRSMQEWKVTEVVVLDEPVASDHLPVVMTLRLTDEAESGLRD